MKMAEDCKRLRILVPCFLFLVSCFLFLVPGLCF